jgi:hypothetical protein
MVCRREHIIEIAENVPKHDETLFRYGQEETFDIVVHKISRLDTLSPTEQETIPPTPAEIGPGVTYKIHAGYRRVLAGFLREIDFTEEDEMKSHVSVFRSTYLMIILDKFAKELAKVVIAAPERFRSVVLNPLLQRQLRGIPDDEVMAVKLEVGPSLADSAKFYLLKDPLDPHHVPVILRNLLYITTVRMSLMYIGSCCPDGDNATEIALHNTGHLSAERVKVSDETWEATRFSGYEVKIMELEGLLPYYSHLLVSGCFISTDVSAHRS